MKAILYLSIATVLLFVGCKKSSTASPASYWILKGNTYKPTYVDFQLDELNGDASNSNFIEIGFLTTPAKSGTYAVYYDSIYLLNTYPNLRCAISVGVGVPNPTPGHTDNYYVATGRDGDSVVLTIAPDGKATAVFNNIQMRDSAGNLSILSGKLVSSN
ncbi:MAG TPA: hypothetical protein VKT28_11665 [Puia sp.]|nr:hypothetical protein [Puia sp.]